MNDLAPGALAKEVTVTLHTIEGRLEAALEPLGLSLAKFGLLSTLVASGEPLPLRLLAEQCSRLLTTVVVASRPVRRILFGTLRSVGGHPSRPAIARRLQRPTRGRTGGPPFPCSALLRMGFTEPSGSPRMLVRSYRTVSPLPVRRLPRRTSPSAVCSLLHFPAGHPDWALPSILPCGVRTFLGRITTPKSGSVRGHPADSPPLSIQSLAAVDGLRP